MFRSIAILLLLNFSVLCYGQNEFNVWHFGSQVGVDFNSGSPLAVSSAIAGLEGTANICDTGGQLLFYTNGVQVWDRNNNVMPNGNGLLGEVSSTQSALICPAPGNAWRYYIFTSDQGGYLGPNLGIHYSIVDMNLNSGLGDVTTLNLPLAPPPSTEKITAVRHCNGRDFWIITHPSNSNEFHCYLLNSAGVNTMPIVSVAGTQYTSVIPGSYHETIGYMKASPNGKHIAVANSGQQFAEFFDFNSYTGIVSNPIKVTYATNEYPYGISYSPNSNLVYVSTGNIPASGIYQYDLTSGNQSSIVNSEFMVHMNSVNNWGHAIQLGPDNKIYVVKGSIAYLDVIANPDVVGAGCNFQDSAVALSGQPTYGLPNNIDAYSAQCPPESWVEFIPNVFTPDDNGVNDKFLVTVYYASQYKLNIYNRWGNLLFTSTDMSEGWDGTTQNGPAADGTYYWIVSYKTEFGITGEKSGFLQLIR